MEELVGVGVGWGARRPAGCWTDSLSPATQSCYLQSLNCRKCQGNQELFQDRSHASF